ncbi:MAG: short-chain dehydrogenase [Cyclobacteriaceae bacterium]|nr:MAG: short-chain dehydrogenase [Cyclobacteriaceae bacterium]
MARVFITGSADGLGQLAAQQLISTGHQVVLHARNVKRAEQAMKKVPKASQVLTADLGNIDQTKELAMKVNDLGFFDAVIHNAGVYQASGEAIFTVNLLAPYILTCRIHKPKRLIYLSSGMHRHGHADLRQLDTSRVTYSDSKLYINILTMAVAHKWPEVYANAVDPGWVPTKMGGAGAPDSLEQGYQTQTWLAVSDDPEAKVTGKYFYHRRVKEGRIEAYDAAIQEALLTICERISGVALPMSNK